MIGLAIMLAAAGTGDFFTGNELYSDICADAGNRAECGLYVTGAVDMALTLAESRKERMPFCLPSNANVGQLTDVFRKELREHPERRNMRGSVLVLASMAEAFPCPKT